MLHAATADLSEGRPAAPAFRPYGASPGLGWFGSAHPGGGGGSNAPTAAKKLISYNTITQKTISKPSKTTMKAIPSTRQMPPELQEAASWSGMQDNCPFPGKGALDPQLARLPLMALRGFSHPPKHNFAKPQKAANRKTGSMCSVTCSLKGPGSLLSLRRVR